MFWADIGHVPYWIKGLSPNDLQVQMTHHVNSMISHTKGK